MHDLKPELGMNSTQRVTKCRHILSFLEKNEILWKDVPAYMDEHQLRTNTGSHALSTRRGHRSGQMTTTSPRPCLNVTVPSHQLVVTQPAALTEPNLVTETSASDLRVPLQQQINTTFGSEVVRNPPTIGFNWKKHSVYSHRPLRPPGC